MFYPGCPGSKLTDRSLMRFKDRIREITRRSLGIPLVRAVKELCVFLKKEMHRTNPVSAVQGALPMGILSRIRRARRFPTMAAECCCQLFDSLVHPLSILQSLTPASSDHRKRHLMVPLRAYILSIEKALSGGNATELCRENHRGEDEKRS